MRAVRWARELFVMNVVLTSKMNRWRLARVSSTYSFLSSTQSPACFFASNCGTPKPAGRGRRKSPKAPRMTRQAMPTWPLEKKL